MGGTKTIQSRINSYWIAKFPFFYYVQMIMIAVSFLFWLGGLLLGAYFLARDTSISMAIWFAGWLTGGAVFFYLSLKYRVGVQIITLDSEAIRFTKRIGFISLRKKISRNELHSVKFKEYDAFNLLTGRDLKLKRRLGWIIVNGDRYYYLNSYLYPLNELQDFTEEYFTSAPLSCSNRATPDRSAKECSK